MCRVNSGKSFTAVTWQIVGFTKALVAWINWLRIVTLLVHGLTCLPQSVLSLTGQFTATGKQL